MDFFVPDSVSNCTKFEEKYNLFKIYNSEIAVVVQS